MNNLTGTEIEWLWRCTKSARNAPPDVVKVVLDAGLLSADDVGHSKSPPPEPRFCMNGTSGLRPCRTRFKHGPRDSPSARQAKDPR